MVLPAKYKFSITAVEDMAEIVFLKRKNLFWYEKVETTKCHRDYDVAEHFLEFVEDLIEKGLYDGDNIS